MRKYSVRRKESIKSIKSKSIEELRRMDDITFKQTFTQVRDVARKRLAKLEQLGAARLLPAAQKLIEGGGIPGWDKTETREEQLIKLKRMLDFIKGQTTKRDLKEYVAEIVRRFKEGGIDITTTTGYNDDGEEVTIKLTDVQILGIVNLANEAYQKAKELAPNYMKYVRYKEVLALVQEGQITNADDFAQWVKDNEDALMAGVLSLQNYRDTLEFNEV